MVQRLVPKLIRNHDMDGALSCLPLLPTGAMIRVSGAEQGVFYLHTHFLAPDSLLKKTCLYTEVFVYRLKNIVQCFSPSTGSQECVCVF